MTGADVFSRHLSYYYFEIYGCMPGSISTVSLKKDIFLKAGGFDEEMKYAGDFDMWVRICDYGPFGVIKVPLVNIRIHKGRASRQIHMAEYKLIDSQKIFKMLLSKVDEEDYYNAKRSFDKLKMPYFFYSYLNLILKGHFKLARRYLFQLVQYENIVRIFTDAVLYFIASKFGFLERYKEKLNQNLKSYFIKS